MRPGEISITEIRSLRSTLAVRSRERNQAKEDNRRLWEIIEEKDREIKLLKAALKARID